jgi:hypothetical protein
MNNKLNSSRRGSQQYTQECFLSGHGSTRFEELVLCQIQIESISSEVEVVLVHCKLREIIFNHFFSKFIYIHLHPNSIKSKEDMNDHFANAFYLFSFFFLINLAFSWSSRATYSLQSGTYIEIYSHRISVAVHGH